MSSYTGLISVIFTTYNSTAWLQKVLWGFDNQNDANFEIIIADDGSSEDTRILIDRFREQTHLKITHVWQEDDGFQKCKIMNKALLKANGEYVLFTDGDCIPRYDFVRVHRQHAEQGYYLSGGYFKLPMDVSHKIKRTDIISGDAFDADWLVEQGTKKTHKLSKLTVKGLKQKFMNFITPTRRTWNGHNASGWKKDLMNINGFDERMQYGGQDCELGYRLKNSGIKAKQVRYSAVVVHLDHKRSYVTPEMLNHSHGIKQATLSSKVCVTKYGLQAART